jgi:GrpB-like predicted nucleotidyltransferase (UPF0157 family)
MTWDFRGRPALNGPIEVVEHDPRWAQTFAHERDRLAAVLGGLALAIEHVGSTAVPGLAAKPVLDILVGVARTPLPEGTLLALGALGYQYRGDSGVPGKQYFRTNPRTRHLHVVGFGGEDWVRTLAFRDYLRAHPAAVQEYAALKRELARLHRDHRTRYLAGKAAFIRSVLERAAAEGPEQEPGDPQGPQGPGAPPGAAANRDAGEPVEATARTSGSAGADGNAPT